MRSSEAAQGHEILDFSFPDPLALVFSIVNPITTVLRACWQLASDFSPVFSTVKAPAASVRFSRPLRPQLPGPEAAKPRSEGFVKGSQI